MEEAVPSDRIAEGDHVILTGGGVKRMVHVLPNSRLRLGSSGSVQLGKLIGMRFGEVVRFDPKERVFVPTNEYPDLDITSLSDNVDEARDNRHLVDDNSSQAISNTEVAAIRQEKGIEGFLSTLVEKSLTFNAKTAFSQEKYLLKKKKRYGDLYKVERVTPEGLSEIHFPTIHPSDVDPEESRWMRLRADTLALILHYANVHSGSRVLTYDRTNGLLSAALLTRLHSDGLVMQVMDKAAQPNVFIAQAMGLTGVRDRWKAVPRNAAFLRGEEREDREDAEPAVDGETATEPRRRVQRDNGTVSQWLRGIDARAMLLERPADSIIIVDDEDPETGLADLMPFLALCGHIVVYSPFLEDLTKIFAKLRNNCVNICVSETWYRHHQILPNRTHPTVNMSTAGGYLLTAIKVEPNANPRPRYENVEALGKKRARDEDSGNAPANCPPQKRGKREPASCDREGGGGG